jgi:Spy/CpxP family protein refolding chaperone
MGANPFREKRVLTPEQKQAMAERLALRREVA